MDITEFYNDFFSTTKNPTGTDVFEKDYNYRDLISFAKEYNRKQLLIHGVVLQSEQLCVVCDNEPMNDDFGVCCSKQCYDDL